MEKYKAKIVKTILFLQPLICGMAGLAVMDGQPVLDSLYQCVAMYLLNYGDTPPNLPVEIARWTAPLMTASGVILAITALRTLLCNYVKYLKGDCVAVYGEQKKKEVVLARLGKRGIDGGEDLVWAHRYIFLGNEEESLALYYRFREKMEGRQVYLEVSSLRGWSSADASLKLFDPEETAARIFWKQCCFYEESQKKNHRLKFVFLGFGKLGEEVLIQALLNNIFSPNQQIEYHIFGADDSFSAVHRKLDQIEDPVYFYQDPWYRYTELLEEADMILLLTQENQTRLLGDLLLAVCQSRITVFAQDFRGAELLDGQDRFRLFYWEREAYRPENILEDTLFEQAKRINLRYASLYSGTAETETEKENQWRRLDAFTRSSNISAADYHEVRLKMLNAMRLEKDALKLPAEVMELFAELEHIRWSRFHYLNNWRWGVPEDGKNKDKTRRIHTDLVSYQDLSEQDKEKDKENIRILLGI